MEIYVIIIKAILTSSEITFTNIDQLMHQGLSKNNKLVNYLCSVRVLVSCWRLVSLLGIRTHILWFYLRDLAQNRIKHKYAKKANHFVSYSGLYLIYL